MYLVTTGAKTGASSTPLPIRFFHVLREILPKLTTTGPPNRAFSASKTLVLTVKIIFIFQ
jgi:hypothetical protein